MKAIIIFNLITNLIIIFVYLYKINPFYFEVQRTFWKNRPYGIMLWKVDRSGYGANGIWSFYFRNGEKLDEKDKPVHTNKKNN